MMPLLVAALILSGSMAWSWAKPYIAFLRHRLRDRRLNRRCPPCPGHRWLEIRDPSLGYGPGRVRQCRRCGRIERRYR